MSSTINSLLDKHIFGGSNKEGMLKAIEEREECIAKDKAIVEELKQKIANLPKYIVRRSS